MKTAHPIAIVVLALVGSTQAQLTKHIALGAAQVCSQIVDRISARNKTTCECDGRFSVSNGLEVDVQCQSASTICVGGELFCGTPNVNATVTPRGIEGTNACLSFDKDPVTDADLPDLCVSATGAGFGKGSTATFASCNVTVGTTACECAICDSGRDFTFDCSAISIPTPSILLPTFPGPKSDRCIGLGILPDIRGDGDGNFNPFGSKDSDSNATATNATAV